jgi:hypothetical protein
MPRKKKIIDELKNVEEDKPITEPKKKAYRVVLVTPNRIVYEVSPKLGNSTTPDIWNGKLKNRRYNLSARGIILWT